MVLFKQFTQTDNIDNIINCKKCLNYQRLLLGFHKGIENLFSGEKKGAVRNDFNFIKQILFL